MDDTNNTSQSGCREGGQCCPPNPSGGKRNSHGWKTLVFTIVILMACGVAAYSLFWRGDNAASTSCCPPGSPEAAACGQAAADPVFDHQSAAVGLNVTALLTDGGSLSGQQLGTIGDLRAALESHGEQLQFQTLRPTDTTYRNLVEQNQVVSFPSFVITGREGTLVLSGDQFDIDTVKAIFKATLATSDASSSEKKAL